MRFSRNPNKSVWKINARREHCLVISGLEQLNRITRTYIIYMTRVYFTDLFSWDSANWNFRFWAMFH